MSDPRLLPLPRTEGCLVCGRANPVGLKLRLHVDPATGSIETHWTPHPHHAGFHDIVHGGAITTVLDEAMAWTAIWSLKRMCVAAELTVRFQKPLAPGTPVTARTRVDSARSRLVLVSGQVLGNDGSVYAESIGKFLPGAAERTTLLLQSMVSEPESAEAAALLRDAIGR
jgi:uncharacterized protein (TIGR00369 family)